jgi:hypothetical protein
MRKAVVVGVDYYTAMPILFGCVTDAQSVMKALARHTDVSEAVNFDIKPLLGAGPTKPVSRDHLREVVHWLFADHAEIALLYFAGHGHIEPYGGYLCASDCRTGFDGLALSEVVTIANQSRAENRIIILDSCHAGAAGVNPSGPLGQQDTALAAGTTIFAASTAEQYSREPEGSGVFTSLLVEALNGAAGNLLGDVTLGGVHEHIDRSLGPWEQRPVFKTNMKRCVSLRRVSPPLVLPELRRISEFFDGPGKTFPLDPSFEPERSGREPSGTPPPSRENSEKFALLQKYSRVNLVVPVDVRHMSDAAMRSTGCRLTALGEHYRQLAQRGRI